MQDMDVVISWFSDGAIAKDAFQRPTRFIQMPTPQPTPDNQEYDHQLEDLAKATGTYGKPLLGLLKKYAPDVRPLRVALVGFSQGCRGPRAMLRTQDGRRIDAVVACDGIHAQFQQGSKTNVDINYVTAWSAFAKMAADGSRLCVISTSAIVPNYPTVSTTLTSDWIWREATGSTKPEYQHLLPQPMVDEEYDPPIVYPAGTAAGGLVWGSTTFTAPPLTQYRNLGSLWILNYENLDPSGHNDHLFQADHVLPMLLSQFLAARWNAIAPDQGICVVSAGDDAAPDATAAAGCFFPTKLSDLYLTGEADPSPLDIDDNANPALPTHASFDGVTASAPSEQDDTATTIAKWAAGVLASGLLIEGARRIGTYLADRWATSSSVAKRKPKASDEDADVLLPVDEPLGLAGRVLAMREHFYRQGPAKLIEGIPRAPAWIHVGTDFLTIDDARIASIEHVVGKGRIDVVVVSESDQACRYEKTSDDGKPPTSRPEAIGGIRFTLVVHAAQTLSQMLGGFFTVGEDRIYPVDLTQLEHPIVDADQMPSIYVSIMTTDESAWLYLRSWDRPLALRIHLDLHDKAFLSARLNEIVCEMTPEEWEVNVIPLDVPMIVGAQPEESSKPREDEKASPTPPPRTGLRGILGRALRKLAKLFD